MKGKQRGGKEGQVEKKEKETEVRRARIDTLMLLFQSLFHVPLFHRFMHFETCMCLHVRTTCVRV